MVVVSGGAGDGGGGAGGDACGGAWVACRTVVYLGYVFARPSMLWS